VLLVEDDEANLLVAATMLEMIGFPCDPVRSGEEAVEKAKSGRYAIVLMDMEMAGMSGLEATNHIRQFEQTHRRPALQILGITANALTQDKERCLQAGMDDYLAKPYSFDLLREKLRQLHLRHRAQVA